jgi:hypothetical protein
MMLFHFVLFALLAVVAFSAASANGYSLVISSAHKLYLRPTFSELSAVATGLLKKQIASQLMETSSNATSSNSNSNSNALVHVEVVFTDEDFWARRRLVTLEELDFPTTVFNLQVLGTMEHAASGAVLDQLLLRSLSKRQFRQVLWESGDDELSLIVDVIVRLSNATVEEESLEVSGPASASTSLTVVDRSLIVGFVVIFIAMSAIMVRSTQRILLSNHNAKTEEELPEKEHTTLDSKSQDSVAASGDADPDAPNDPLNPANSSERWVPRNKSSPDDAAGGNSANFLLSAIGDWFRSMSAIQEEDEEEEDSSLESSSGWTTGDSHSSSDQFLARESNTSSSGEDSKMSEYVIDEASC